MEKIKQNIIDDMIELRKNKYSIRDISKKLNIGTTTVSRYVKGILLENQYIDIWKKKNKGIKRQPTSIDYSGNRFERLLLLERVYKIPGLKKRHVYRCLCDCGNETMVRIESLLNGTTKSCGCYSRDKARERNQKYPDKVNIHSLFLSYKRGAENRDIEFSLSEVFCEKLFKSDCIYCGNKPMRERKIHKNQNDPERNFGFKFNGIDRKDNSKGYTIENCVPCCTYCNYAKRDRKLSDFTERIDNLVEYNNKLKRR